MHYVFSVHAYWFIPSVSALALDILWYILAFMPPAISPTSSSSAYRKLCRMRTTSTCTSCRTRSLQDCRFTPRMAQMAAAVSISFVVYPVFMVCTSKRISQFCQVYGEGNLLSAAHQGKKRTLGAAFTLFSVCSGRFKVENKA